MALVAKDDMTREEALAFAASQRTAAQVRYATGVVLAREGRGPEPERDGVGRVWAAWIRLEITSKYNPFVSESVLILR